MQESLRTYYFSSMLLMTSLVGHCLADDICQLK